MITVDQVKKYLPPDTLVTLHKNMINMDATIFICASPYKYMVDGEEKQIAFAVTISALEAENLRLDDLIEQRCKIGLEQALEHVKKYERVATKTSLA